MSISSEYLFQEQPISILFTEDNELNQFLISKLLSNYKDKVEFAESGYDAIEKIRKNHYDIVFMDINLPKLNGIKATQMIRNDFNLSGNQLPIIAMTAAENSNMKAFMDAGMNGYINKPFEVTELKEILAKHLGNNSKATINEPVIAPFTFGNITNKDVLAKMISLFKKHKKEFFEQVTFYMGESNFEAISNTAHKMKSTADVIGMPELKDALHKLEKSAQAQDRVQMEQAYKKAQELFIVSEKALEQFN
ncbi:MAG: response regulator [Sporocytophaga sp.]|uniref:response regulator n=1 Tax=Sporocytophaga sp. TaxID=2231183 RepID=UPI001B17E10C|nr:response regulator [Sporocytophaga sp.]MBO9701621.1 response regulator [Sporocytophaga sp.]